MLYNLLTGELPFAYPAQFVLTMTQPLNAVTQSCPKDRWDDAKDGRDAKSRHCFRFSEMLPIDGKFPGMLETWKNQPSIVSPNDDQAILVKNNWVSVIHCSP